MQSLEQLARLNPVVVERFRLEDEINKEEETLERNARHIDRLQSNLGALTASDHRRVYRVLQLLRADQVHVMRKITDLYKQLHLISDAA